MNAAIYVRVSSKVQSEGYSPEIQEQECRTYAAEHGLSVIEPVYADVHTGVELWERPVLSKLREDMRAGNVDALIFHTADRLARDPIYQEFVIEDAVRYDIDVHCVMEPIDQTETGRLIRYLKGWKAKLEWEDIRRRTQSGRRARVKARKPLPGPRPMYGYQWADDDKSRLRINPETAPVIQRIYEELAGGKSAMSIAKTLTEERVPTPSGRNIEWRSPSIREMVPRPHYAGRALGWVNREKSKEAQYEDVPDAIELPEGVFPAIVSEELWQQANDEMKTRRVTRHAERDWVQEALLVNGYAICAYCGRAMCTKWHQRQTQNYTCCGDRSKKGSCEMPTISVKKLDRLVWGGLKERLSQPDIIIEELRRYRESDPTESDLGLIAQRQKEVDRQLGNLTRRLATVDDDGIAALVMNEMQALREQQVRLTEERATLEWRRDQWQAGQNHLDRIEEWCQSVSESLDDLTRDEKRTLFSAIGLRVTVWKVKDRDPRYQVNAVIDLDSETTPSKHGTCHTHCRY